MTSGPPLIDMHRVSVMRGTRIALDDITLRISAGEHVAIIGPNGCGKSTLVKTITRECYPLLREGTSLSILGRDRWHVFELRSLLGIVSNDLMQACTREITGEEVVLSGFFSGIGVSPRDQITTEMRERAQAALRRLEASYLTDRYVTEMSSGEARRVILARALVHDPKALLLDEPSTALDMFAQHELREMLRKLASEGLTILMVTHHLSDIFPEIERVVLMQNGKIAADGPKQDVLTPAILSSLFGVRVAVGESGGCYYLWQHMDGA